MIIDIKKELDDIIRKKQIKIVFQPIISLRDGSILGHEALSRITSKSAISNPEMLFAAAQTYKRLWELEQLCRTTALETAFKFMDPPYSKKLFLNVNPHVMHDDHFKKGFTSEFLKQYHITSDNIIFEITEKSMVMDTAGFQQTINHYKNQNYKIAIDDAGAGYSGLNLISDVNPNYIKLDMNLIRGIHEDSLKYALVKGMAELSKASGIALIAEGIETYEELQTVTDLGVQYGQGYFIQRPDENIHEIGKEVLLVLEEINQIKSNSAPNSLSSTCIKGLCTYTSIVLPNEKVSHVYDIFRQDANCFGLCVIENQKPVGIVTREKLALQLSGHYGFTLHQNKSICSLMDQQFLCVDCRTPVSEVSSKAMSRSSDRLYDFIVVTENGKYLGTVTIKDLLQKASEIEVTMAKHQNPLSGLPGNLIIEQKLKQCVESTQEYGIAYFDIDNFKAYNDVYGFENGDSIIQYLAKALKQNLPVDDFVGHVGGDDFVVIFYHETSQAFSQKVVTQFEKFVLTRYNQDDLKRGYITAVSRSGNVEKYPLMTLTCVAVNSCEHQFTDVFTLTELLASLKKQEKRRKALAASSFSHFD